MHKFLRATFSVLAAGAMAMFAPKQAQASHVAGSDMSYVQVAPGVYLVTINLYRDCRGIEPSTTLSLDIVAPGCGSAPSVTLPRTGAFLNGEEVSDVCQGQTTACSSPPNNNVPGIKKYVYSGLVFMPAQQCANWTFSWDECCRNAAIVNLNAPGSQDFYTEAIVNTTITGSNSSPVFGRNPVPYVCNFDTVQLNPQVTDPDGDSLAFSLAPALDLNAVPLVYASGYQPTLPFGPNAVIAGTPTLDPVTGQLSFRPTSTGAYVVVVRVDEFRRINGVVTKIGTVQRDVQVQVVNCNTPPPTLGKPIIVLNLDTINISNPNVPIPFEACANQCLRITTIPRAGTTISINSDAQNQIPGSNWQQTVDPVTNNPVFEFCWAPTINDVSSTPRFFTFTVQDNACPYPNSVDVPIQLRVRKTTGLLADFQENNPNANPPITDRLDSICEGQAARLMPVRRNTSLIRYNTANYPTRTWTATDLSGNALTLYDASQTPLQFPAIDSVSGLMPSVYVNQTTIFTLTATTKFGCTEVISDTIFSNLRAYLANDFQSNKPLANPPLIGRTDSVCVGQGIMLMPERSGNRLTYDTLNFPIRTWTATDLAGNPISLNSDPFTIELPYISDRSGLMPMVYPTQNTIFTLTTTSILGCTESVSDTIFVSGSTASIDLEASAMGICYGDSVNTDSTKADFIRSPDLPNDLLRYKWTAVDPLTSFPLADQTVISNDTILNPVLRPTMTTKFYLDVFAGACSTRDSLTILVGDSIMADFTLDFERLNQNDSVSTAPPVAVFVNNATTPRIAIDSLSWVLYEIIGTGSNSVRIPRDTIAGDLLFDPGIWFPEFVIENEGLYLIELKVYDRDAGVLCQYSRARGLRVEGKFVPNVITPNGDGKNDKFVITGIRSGSKVTIFSRWGNKVADLKDTEAREGWDPKDLPAGIYYFLLEEGSTGKREKSWLQIIR